MNDDKIIRASRLEKEFKRQNKDISSRNNLDDINNALIKNLYITTKSSKDKNDELAYSINKMNKMGRSSRKILHAIEPSSDLSKVKKAEKPKYGALAFPSMAFAALFTPAIINSFKKPNIKRKGNDVEGDPDNIFGLTTNDKNKIKLLQEKTGDSYASLSKIIQKVSIGVIPSLSAFIFNFSYYQTSGIYKLFKVQLEKFQKGALEIFTKIFTSVTEWLKDNLYNPVISGGMNLAGMLKEKAVNLINNVFKSDLGNKSIKDNSLVPNVKPSLAESLKRMVLSFVGANVDYSDRIEKVKKKSFIDHIKEATSFSSNDEDSAYSGEDIVAGEEFVGMPVSANLKTQSGVQLAVYAGLRKAGFSDNQARILNAEIGRESSFALKNIFGYHKDPHKGVNLGMISWQGKRGRNLEKWMASAGLVKNGRMIQSQASIDMQAKFIIHEMRTDKSYARTKKVFLENPNVSYNVAKEVLGNNYIRWRYTDRKYAQGHKNRDTFYRSINNSLKKEAAMGDMSWDTAPKSNTVKAIKRNIENKPKNLVKTDSTTIIEFAIDIPSEINTNITKKKKAFRSGLSSNFNMPKTDNKEVFPKSSSSFIPSPQETQPQQYTDTSSVSATNNSNESMMKPKKSFYEELMEMDISGNMF